MPAAEPAGPVGDEELPHRLLVRERPVHVRRIEQGDPELDGAFEIGDTFFGTALVHVHGTEIDEGGLVVRVAVDRRLQDRNAILDIRRFIDTGERPVR